MESFLAPVIPTSSVTEDPRPAQSSDCDQTRTSITRRVNILITERLAAEEQTNNDFREALSRMRTMHEGLQAQLRLIPDGARARARSENPPDVPTPPAPSKDVIAEAQTQRQAARPPAPNQVARMGKASTVHSATFPLPKASQVRKPPSRPHIPSVPTVERTQPTRRLKLDTLKHRSTKISRAPEPAATVPQPSRADGGEGMPKVTHQSVGEARPTTTQERNAPVCLHAYTP
jgi:hypothetical protein